MTINVAITFAANNSSSAPGNTNGFNPFGQIDAVDGNLTFGTGTLSVSGPSVYGLQLLGSPTLTTTFNDTVNARNATDGGNADKYIALIGTVVNGLGTGTNMTVGGTFNSGDIYLMNGSTLNLAEGGTINTGAVLILRRKDDPAVVQGEAGRKDRQVEIDPRQRGKAERDS